MWEYRFLTVFSMESGSTEFRDVRYPYVYAYKDTDYIDAMPTRPAVAPILVHQTEVSGKTVVIGETYVVHRPQQPSRKSRLDADD